MAKFSDIKKFTSTSNYDPDMGWEFFVNNWLPENETELNLQLCPDFQRGHVWTEEQQIKYIEYCLKGGMNGKDIYFNHPGWQSNYEGEFVCVDGLQRITAVKRFIHNEIKAFGYYFKEYEDRLSPFECRFKVHINNLKTRHEVLQWYVEMNDGGTVHTREEIERVKGLLEVERKWL